MLACWDITSICLCIISIRHIYWPTKTPCNRWTGICYVCGMLLVSSVNCGVQRYLSYLYVDVCKVTLLLCFQIQVRYTSLVDISICLSMYVFGVMQGIIVSLVSCLQYMVHRYINLYMCVHEYQLLLCFQCQISQTRLSMYVYLYMRVHAGKCYSVFNLIQDSLMHSCANLWVIFF